MLRSEVIFSVVLAIGVGLSIYVRAEQVAPTPKSEACVIQDVECTPRGKDEDDHAYCDRIAQARSGGNPGYTNSYCRFDRYGRLSGFSARYISKTERQAAYQKPLTFKTSGDAVFESFSTYTGEADMGRPFAETAAGVTKLGILGTQAQMKLLDKDLEACLPEGTLTIPANASAGAIALETLSHAITSAGLLSPEISRAERGAQIQSEISLSRTIAPISLMQGRAVQGTVQGPIESGATIGERFDNAVLVLKQKKRPDLAKTLITVKNKLSKKNDSVAVFKANALSLAHQVGEGGVGKYTTDELMQKVRLLDLAGFTKVEREAIIRSGLAGSKERTGITLVSNPEAVESVSNDYEALKKAEQDLIKKEQKQLELSQAKTAEIEKIKNTPAKSLEYSSDAVVRTGEMLADEFAPHLLLKQNGENKELPAQLRQIVRCTL